MSKDSRYVRIIDLTNTAVVVEGFAWSAKVAIRRGKKGIVLDKKSAPAVRQALEEWEKDTEEHEAREKAEQIRNTPRPKSGTHPGATRTHNHQEI